MNRHMCDYVRVTGELLESEQVRSMGQWRHHGPVTCLDHSLFVSYLSFRAARLLGLDFRAAARAGLLHDLYLYDPATKPSPRQCIEHPVIAARNAGALTPLSKKEHIYIKGRTDGGGQPLHRKNIVPPSMLMAGRSTL